MRGLFIEPYYGGSHRAVIDGLLDRMDIEADLLTMPARKWKWRMRGAAINMSAQIHELAEERPDGSCRGPAWDFIFASTFVNLAELYGLAGSALEGVPSVVYFHENQFVYPNRHEAEWDFQFPLTNITSALAADVCLFNSEWTRRTLLAEIPGFIRQFPDHHPAGVSDAIALKSQVIAPPFDATEFDAALPGGVAVDAPRGDRTRIVWPHRWEHDKDPDTFFEAVAALADEGLDFEVCVAGQSFTDVPASILSAEARLGDRLVHMGEPEGRRAYAELLASSDIAVSTAANEFFGLAMMEAAYSGCFPLVPDRLAYKELYPDRMRYRDREDLVAMLRILLTDRPDPGQGRELAEGYTFEALTPSYLGILQSLAASRRR